VIHILPFAACQIVGRLLFKQYPIPALAICAVGCAITAITYWRSVLPESLKNGLHSRYKKAGRKFGFVRAAKVAE
jgi:hypothetical protein